MLIGMPYERGQSMSSGRLFSQAMERSIPLILVRQEGGEGLGVHKSDTEELKEQDDLEMIWQRG